MGREIVYCSQCGVRILEKDLAAGRAFTVLDKVFCAECRDQAFTQVKAEAPAARQSAPAKAAPSRVAAAPPRPAAPAAPAARPVPRAPAPHAPHAPRVIVHAPNRTGLYIACAAGVLAMVVVIVVILSKSSDQGTGTAGTGEKKTGPVVNPNETPEERAKRLLNELHKAVGTAKTPEEALRLIVAAEKGIVSSPSEEGYRKLRKQWERKVAEGEAGKKIDAWFAEVKTIRAGDADLLRLKETMELLQKAEELATTDCVDRLAEIKTFKKDIEEAVEVKADSWMEEKSRGEKIRAFMRELDFKAAKSIILTFPEHLKISRTWKVQLSRNLEDCEKGIAAQAAKAAGKEPEKDWKNYLRLGRNDLGLKNYARAKDSLLKAEAKLPAFDTLTDVEKQGVAWEIYYNVACIFAEESKKLEGAEKTTSVDQAFVYLKKSAEAGVFGYRCGCGDRDHKAAKDHWDTDKDLETIRSDARYAELIAKYVK